MATINYKGVSGVRDTLTVNTTDDLDTIGAAIAAAEGLDISYYSNFVLERDPTINAGDNGGDTYADLGLTADDFLIGILSDNPETYTKEERQLRKLELAAIKRASDGRPSTYDVNRLPNPYNDNDVDPDDGASTLTEGRPWA